MKKITKILLAPRTVKITKLGILMLFLLSLVYLIMPKWFYAPSRDGGLYKYNAVSGKLYFAAHFTDWKFVDWPPKDKS